MRRHARIRAGRILGLGTGIWLRRWAHVHAVAILCLAPLWLMTHPRNPVEDEGVIGLFGLYSTAWAVSFELFDGAPVPVNVFAAYFAQFALTVILVRQAHRGLPGRRPLMRARALFGLALLALGSLAGFVLLDGVVVSATDRQADSAAIVLVLAVAVTVAEGFAASRYCLALPAAAVDGHGLRAALRRSRELAAGSHIAVAVAVALPILLQWALMIPFAMWSNTIATWGFAVPIVLFVTLKACILAAAYEEASRGKGPRLEEIRAVFS